MALQLSEDSISKREKRDQIIDELGGFLSLSVCVGVGGGGGCKCVCGFRCECECCVDMAVRAGVHV